MNDLKKCIVITTINPTNSALEKFASTNYDLIIVGDKKSPKKYDVKSVYLDISKQEELFDNFSNLMPFNHYCRKNLGYLYAIKQGYEIIGESDDDNVPYDNWGKIPVQDSFLTITAPRFPNIYKEFSDKKIWPRGYPLDLVMSSEKTIKEQKSAQILIWQGLADGDTDVDAVYRLTINEPVTFFKDKEIVLSKGIVSPFNSQNTLWQKAAHVYLYLPHTVTFRYTDILRSFVAQFGIWALGGNLGFMSPSVSSMERNYHNILKDFADEVPMYNTFYSVIDILQNCRLTGQKTDLLVMYESLAEKGIVKEPEINSVKEWLKLLE